MVHVVLFWQQSGTSNATSLWWSCSSPCVPSNCLGSQLEILAKAKPFSSGIDLNNFWNTYFLKSSNASMLAVVQTKKTDGMGNLWHMKSLHQYWIALFWYFCSNLDQHLRHVQVTHVRVTFHVLPKASFSSISIFFLMRRGFWSWVWQLDSILSSPQISLPGEMPAFVTYNTKLLHSSLHSWVSVLQKEAKSFISARKENEAQSKATCSRSPLKVLGKLSFLHS